MKLVFGLNTSLKFQSDNYLQLPTKLFGCKNGINQKMSIEEFDLGLCCSFVCVFKPHQKANKKSEIKESHVTVMFMLYS